MGKSYPLLSYVSKLPFKSLWQGNTQTSLNTPGTGDYLTAWIRDWIDRRNNEFY